MKLNNDLWNISLNSFVALFSRPFHESGYPKKVINENVKRLCEKITFFGKLLLIGTNEPAIIRETLFVDPTFMVLLIFFKNMD